MPILDPRAIGRPRRPVAGVRSGVEGIMDGWLSACREAGWSPKWPSPGSRNCMIGTHYNVIVADAVARGITDWNVEEAFTYLWKDATANFADCLIGAQNRRMGCTATVTFDAKAAKLPGFVTA